MSDKIRILYIVPSLRLDNIVSDLAKTSKVTLENHKSYRNFK